MTRMYSYFLCGIVLGLVAALAGCSGQDKDRITASAERVPLTSQERQKLLAAITLIQEKTDARQAAGVHAGFEQAKKDFPKIAKLDLGLFAKAEEALSRDNLGAAVKSYLKLTKTYPDSELHQPSMQRVFQIGKTYLEGATAHDFGLFRIRGYGRGVKILDDLTTEVGLEDPNGLGVQAAVLVARHHERWAKERGKPDAYDEAYLKWQEISTQWESGPIGQEALFGMANAKLGSYNREPPNRRHMFDGSRLTTARGYFERYRTQYPQDANQADVGGIIRQIDQQLAYQQFMIGRYYQRTRHAQAANLYFEMVVQTWPSTPAAQMAREALAKAQQ